MPDDPREPFGEGVTRRTFIKGTGVGAVAVLGGSLYATAPAAARARRVSKVDTPIRQVMISCQENRSFDHYFGYAPRCRRPASVPRPATPSRTRTATRTSRSVHEPRDGRSAARLERRARAVERRCDGRVLHERGHRAMGYYTAAQLPFYYSLLDDSALVSNFFCSLLGPTWPNRFYLAAGTSGGITTNSIWGYGVFDYPIILDLLDAAGVTLEGLQPRHGQRPLRQHRQRVRLLEEVRARHAHAREQGLLPQRRPARTAAPGLLADPELRAGLGRASARRRLGRDGHPGGLDHGGAGIVAVGELGVHAHLRRARRLLRPRAAEAARCVRSRVSACPRG